MSLSHRERALIMSLHQRRQRAANGLFLAEGVRVVEELLGSSLVLRMALVSSSLGDTERGRTLQATLESAVDTRVLAASELGRLADSETSQGVLVVAAIPESTLAELPCGPADRILVLDAVQDPGNLGTLARTAAALGVGGLVVLPGTVDPWNEKVVRASAGALFRLPVVMSDWDAARDWLAASGYGVYVADAAGTPVTRVAIQPRAALVVGNEGAGVRSEIAAGAHAALAVPARGMESLNVAIAAGILLWEMVRADAESS